MQWALAQGSLLLGAWHMGIQERYSNMIADEREMQSGRGHRNALEPLYRFCKTRQHEHRKPAGMRTHLGEADRLRFLAEALTAEVEAVLADETSLVGAEAAAKRGRSAYAPRLARPSPTSILRSIARLLLPLSHSRTAYAYH